MGEAEERYWQAVQSDHGDGHERAFDAALPWSDRFEFMGREIERQAELFRLCQDARDEALMEIFEPPRRGFGKRQHEFAEIWPKQVLSHENLLRYLIDQMDLMRLRKPRVNDEAHQPRTDDQV